MKVHLRGGDSNRMLKWGVDVKPGDVLAGVLLAIRPGKYGPLADYRDDRGAIVTIPLPTTLAPLVARVRLGAGFTLEYLGKKSGKVNSFHAFDLEVDDADILETPRVLPGEPNTVRVADVHTGSVSGHDDGAPF